MEPVYALASTCLSPLSTLIAYSRLSLTWVLKSPEHSGVSGKIRIGWKLGWRGRIKRSIFLHCHLSTWLALEDVNPKSHCLSGCPIKSCLKGGIEEKWLREAQPQVAGQAPCQGRPWVCLSEGVPREMESARRHTGINFSHGWGSVPQKSWQANSFIKKQRRREAEQEGVTEERENSSHDGPERGFRLYSGPALAFFPCLLSFFLPFFRVVGA